MLEPLDPEAVHVGNEDDGSDVVDVLKAYRKAWGHRMKGFQLQRYQISDIVTGWRARWTARVLHG